MTKRSFAVAAVWIGILVAGLGAPPVWAEYRSTGKRDPFVALLTAEGQRMHPPGFDEEVAGGIEGLSLQGIVYDAHAESYAVLNGKIIREKEEIDFLCR